MRDARSENRMKRDMSLINTIVCGKSISFASFHSWLVGAVSWAHCDEALATLGRAGNSEDICVCESKYAVKSFTFPPTGAGWPWNHLEGGPALLEGGPALLEGGPALLEGGPALLEGGPALLEGGPALLEGGPMLV